MDGKSKKSWEVSNMPCPKCGKVMCDCSPAERGQTTETMMNQYYKDVQKTVAKKGKDIKKRLKK